MQLYHRALIEYIPEETTQFEEGVEEITIKTQSKKLGKTTIKLYPTTGRITIQGRETSMTETGKALLNWVKIPELNEELLSEAATPQPRPNSTPSEEKATDNNQINIVT